MSILLSSRDDEVLYLARKQKYVRELPNNRGLRVEAIQHWSDGAAGDSWCMEWVWMILDMAYEGQSPIGGPDGQQRLQSCEELHQLAFKHGWVTNDPGPADLALRVSEFGYAHHVYIVTSVNGQTLGTVSGNTSKDGTSSNGDGVYEHDVTRDSSLVFVKYPR